MQVTTEKGMRDAVEHYTKLNRTQIQCITGLDLIQCIVTLSFGCNFKTSLYFAIPQAIAAVILLFLAERTHLMDSKRMNLLSGLAGMLVGLGCAIGSLFIIPLKEKELLFTILGSLFIYLFGMFSGFMHDFMIAREKTPWLSMLGMSGAAIGVGGARIGGILSRMMRDGTEIDWKSLCFVCYLLFTFVGAYHIMYLVRSYYASVLEKLEEERTPKRRMACRH